MSLRLIIDTLIAVMLVATLTGVAWHHGRQRVKKRREQAVHSALSRLHDQVILRAAIGDAEGDAKMTRGGFPDRILREWFDGKVPINTLVPKVQPWLDVAPEGDLSDHPPDSVVTGPRQAGVWYNPKRGIFRARVMPQFTASATRDLYNRLNGTNLARLPDEGTTAAPDDAAPDEVPPERGAPGDETPAASTVKGASSGDAAPQPSHRRRTLADRPQSR